MSIDWDNLQIVLAVSRGGSLTAAAGLLAIDQTTAGRRLSALETQLDKTLFLRSKAGFKPTEEGEVVIRAALEVEARMERLTDQLQEPDGTATGLVRLLANPWMLERLAAKRLANLLAANPGLELRLSGRLPPTPLHGGTTISLWFDAEARGPDIAIPFGRVPYAAFKHVDLPDENTDWVIFRDDDARGPSITRQLANRLPRGSNVRFPATDAQTLCAAAQAGIGRAVLPLCLGVAATGLVRDESVAPIARILHVHLNPDFAKTRRVQTLLDWLRPAISGDLSGEALNFPKTLG